MRKVKTEESIEDTHLLTTAWQLPESAIQHVVRVSAVVQGHLSRENHTLGGALKPMFDLKTHSPCGCRF